MSTTKTAASRLNRERVVGAALDLIEQEGVDALSMRALAVRLGVVPMALYRHVEDRDDLLDAVLDATAALVPLPSPRLKWRRGLAMLSRAIRRTMLEHAGVVGLLISRPNLGPSALAIGEYGFGVMRGAGFRDRDVEQGVNLVLTYTLGFAALEVPRRPRRESIVFRQTYAQSPLEAFPNAAAIAPDPFEFASEAQFEFGLDRILDALDRLPRKGDRAGQ